MIIECRLVKKETNFRKTIVFDLVMYYDGGRKGDVALCLMKIV